MKTSSKMLFYIMMILSTLMILNSKSWITMWMMLEVNLMSFIPLMSNYKNSFNSQSIMMYFLTQSLASMLFIMFIFWDKYMFAYSSKELVTNLIMMSMFIKMGMPPFHMWFPEVMNKISWMTCFLLMTWQKIGPMYIISTIISLNKGLSTLICLSALIGAIGGINQTSTRKIMAYSSINHLSWLIACAATFKKSWMMYLLIYSIMMMITAFFMNEYNIMFINQMNMFYSNNMNKIIIIMLMMSMGGLPPFLGFIPKWITIQYLMSSNEFLMMMIMVTSALITLSYYIRMSSSMNLIMGHSQKWMFFMNVNSKTSKYIFMLNLMLPLSIMLMNFY